MGIVQVFSGVSVFAAMGIVPVYDNLQTHLVFLHLVCDSTCKFKCPMYDVFLIAVCTCK